MVVLCEYQVLFEVSLTIEPTLQIRKLRHMVEEPEFKPRSSRVPNCCSLIHSTTGTRLGYFHNLFLTLNRLPASPRTILGPQSLPWKQRDCIMMIFKPYFTRACSNRKSREGQESQSCPAPFQTQLLQFIGSALHVVMGFCVKNSSLAIKKNL